MAILFHQAIADRLGMHLTDHKCAEILLRSGPLTAGDLAQRTGLTTGAIMGVIDRLEKAGFVRRGKDPGTGGESSLSPSPERSEKVIAPLFGSVAQMVSDLCARYSYQEITVVRDLIARFNEGAFEEIRKLREGEGPAKRAHNSCL